MKRVQFDHFYRYDELADFLKSAAAEYSQYMHLDVLTQTEEGREVFLVTLADFALGSEAENRGAYYVQSGIHANEGAGTTAAIHLIETVLTAENKKELLHNNVFYIIPRVNPDGVEYCVTKCASIRSKMDKIDNLPNAVIPKDMNNDGMILSMRWEDPLGNFKKHPTIPDYMIPRKPGDMEGPFYSMCSEGEIENYDGGKPQFGMRNRDLNRSLPIHWNPVSNAADYPVRDVESRAVVEFLITHPNIYAGIDYHCGSSGFLHPMTSALSDVAIDDQNIMTDVGALGEKMTGLPVIHEREYHIKGTPYPPAYGCSNDFSYEVLGISHYVIELGNGFTGIGLHTRDILDGWRTEYENWSEQAVKRNIDLGREVIAPWKEYDHPQLGKVEIGGYKDGEAFYMYPRDMGNLIPKTSQFLLKHAEMGPKLLLGNVEKLDLGNGVYRIRAAVLNNGTFGTTVMTGSHGYNAQKNVIVTLKGNKNAAVLSRPALYTFKQIHSMGSELLEWFVKGETGEVITLTASHPKSADAVVTLTL